MNQRKVAVVLAVAAAAVVLENMLLWDSAPPPAASEEEAEPALASEGGGAPAELSDVNAAAVREYLASLPNPERARSPFLTRLEADSLAVADPGAGGPVLTLAGTLFSAERRVAWLDGAPAVEGDFVAGRELLRIEQRSVVLEDGGAELRVFVQPELRVLAQPSPRALDAADAAGADAELLQELEQEATP